MNTLLATTAQSGPLERLFFRRAGMTQSALNTDGMFFMIFWFSTFFFVLLMGLMVYWCIKYRRRPGVPAEVSPSHNGPLEIIWTIVPSSSLLVMFLLGFWGYMDKMTPPAESLVLNVKGGKWYWNIVYPDGSESPWLKTMNDALPDGRVGKEFPVFVVPEDTPIHLKMTSVDVIHSFWIPDMRVKMDLFPNRYTGYTFRTPKLNVGETFELANGDEIAGRSMWVFCAEYCGDLHSEMAATIVVVPRADYKQIVEVDWKMGIPLPDLGEILWKQRCSSCHSVDGAKNTGPTWLNSFGYMKTMRDGEQVLVDENYIRESILEPGVKVVAGYENQMVSFQGQLSDRQLDGIIAYFRALSDKGGELEIEGDEVDEGAETPADGE